VRPAPGIPCALFVMRVADIEHSDAKRAARKLRHASMSARQALATRLVHLRLEGKGGSDSRLRPQPMAVREMSSRCDGTANVLQTAACGFGSSRSRGRQRSVWARLGEKRPIGSAGPLPSREASEPFTGSPRSTQRPASRCPRVNLSIFRLTPSKHAEMVPLLSGPRGRMGRKPFTGQQKRLTRAGSDLKGEDSL